MTMLTTTHLTHIRTILEDALVIMAAGAHKAAMVLLTPKAGMPHIMLVVVARMLHMDNNKEVPLLNLVMLPNLAAMMVWPLSKFWCRRTMTYKSLLVAMPFAASTMMVHGWTLVMALVVLGLNPLNLLLLRNHYRVFPAQLHWNLPRPWNKRPHPQPFRPKLLNLNRNPYMTMMTTTRKTNDEPSSMT